MKKIALPHGLFAKVSNKHFASLNKYKWYVDGNGYAVHDAQHKGKKVHYRMHRVVTNAPQGMDVHHRDHDKLNNQLRNLVICTRGENCRASSMRSHNTSGYIGVYRFWGRKLKREWAARVIVNGHSINLGYFLTAKEAAIARDKAAKKHHGRFAVLNFPT